MNMWEQDALLGLACLYGIELLHDNVRACRQRLLEVFIDAYRGQFGESCRRPTIKAAQIIAQANILHGDALAMTTIGDNKTSTDPLVFTEWSMVSGGRFKRRLFEFQHLVRSAEDTTGKMFSGGIDAIDADHGQTVFIEKPVGDLPLIHYLRISEERYSNGDATDRA